MGAMRPWQNHHPFPFNQPLNPVSLRADAIRPYSGVFHSPGRSHKILRFMTCIVTGRVRKPTYWQRVRSVTKKGCCPTVVRQHPEKINA